MVHHQYEYMIVFIQSHDSATNPGCGGEVERPSKLLGHQPIDFCVALWIGSADRSILSTGIGQLSWIT